MYVWIWRHLPGNAFVRVLQSLVLFGLVVAVLFTWVFPAIEADLPYQDVTVPGPSESGTATPGPTDAPTGQVPLPTELPAG